MLSPNEIEALPKPLEKQFRNLENRIMADIVRRLKKANEMTSGAEYQAERFLNLGVSQKDIERLIGNTLEISQNEVSKIYDDIIAKGYARGLNLVKSAGGDIAPYKENKSLQQLISAVKSQTNNSFKNITQSLGFAVNQNGKTVFRPIADYYQKTLDSAVLDITTGAFDYNTVLKRIVNEMINSGLRSVDYASGHSDRVEVAARRAVMTGVNQVTAKVAEQNMDALDTEYVEVSWHSGARPSHQVWQGKIYHWDREKNHRNPQSSVDNSDKSSIIDTRESNFKSNLAKGLINTVIEPSQQQKHQLTKAWKNQVKQAIVSGGRLAPKSRLNKDINPQEIVNQYAGTGNLRFFKNSDLPNEFITLPYIVGYTYDDKIGKYVKTHVIQIKYTKNGVHIFPTMERSVK
ncbi:MAG TPA: hypothetical protein DCQ78_00060 [Ruminococcus sp.]|nr:hypothetical protein [Ruminococcus sp.]